VIPPSVIAKAAKNGLMGPGQVPGHWICSMLRCPTCTSKAVSGIQFTHIGLCADHLEEIKVCLGLSANGKTLEADQVFTGMGASPGEAKAEASFVASHVADEFVKGRVLVTWMTTPEYVGAMRRAVAIVTTRGGRLCHAAIVSREFGVPCVVGVRGLEPFLNRVSGLVFQVDGTAGTVHVVG